MADLIISKVALDDSVAKLATIKGELDHQRSDDRALDPVYGQKDLHDAMRDFSSDWEIHRQSIHDAVGDLYDSLEKQQESWSGSEKNLAEALSTEKESA